MTFEAPCGHCGRLCGDYFGGYATIDLVQVCHPNAPDRPNCYELVTVQKHQLLRCPKCMPVTTNAEPRTWAMPPEPDPDVIRVRDVYGQCFSRADAIDENGSIPVWLGDAFTDEADVPDLYLSWQQLMKEHGPLTEVVSDVD